MRISDWSSDVCSSDLVEPDLHRARLFARDRRHAVDALEQALRIDLEQLVVRGRDHAAVIGEGAIDQLRGQHRMAKLETDLAGLKADFDIAFGLVEQDRKSTRLNSSH